MINNEFYEVLTEKGWMAHQANQVAIEANLKAHREAVAPDYVYLEMISEDGIRAQHTLDLIRDNCEHGEFEHGICVYCGELEVNTREL